MAVEPGRCIRVAMLNADTSVPNVYGGLGTFGDILQRVLAAVAPRAHAGLSIRHSVYNVVSGQYPESPGDVDALIITASAASSYDDQPWIQRLEEYVVMMYRRYPGVKMFGSCFGHHLICQALLKKNKDCGGMLRVEKHPSGWEIGISEVVFTDDFRRAFSGRRGGGTRAHRSTELGFPGRCVGRLPSPDEDEDDSSRRDYAFSSTGPATGGFVVPGRARLQFIHADQVFLASPLVQPWVLVGSTEHCAVQGVFLPGRILTLQGHFEFDKFENRQTMKIFGAGPEDGAEAGTARDVVDGLETESRQEVEDDGEVMAEMVVRFLAGGQLLCNDPSMDSTMGDLRSKAWPGKLPTPRTSTERF